jgi:hypothetical protein
MHMSKVQSRPLADQALDAFWQVIVTHLPQATTGDLSPERTIRLQLAAEEAIQEWIANNVPDDAAGRRRSFRTEAGMTLSNQERADRCQQAIDSYSDDDTYTNLVDFLADAMHFCHVNGHCFHDALDTAQMHFDAELADDDILDDLNHEATTERTQP